MTKQPEYRRKLEYYKDALHAATKINSEICQLEDQIGTLEVGKLADISAWKRDLLTDPCAFLDCAFVMKEGIVYPTEKCEELAD